jgi:pilus assembly protein TadC
MDDRDQRARELRQLRSDLAGFARRLDAFEARRKLSSLTEAIKAATSPVNNVEFAKQIVSAMKGARRLARANKSREVPFG